ncbi:hypothetical protein DOTSEDRAFT_38479 [Dothistroma septosporum NZE10]|uniref:F-box domain-containing protein n=1 Tax=Dothistroma septosporum (strain NZE10 / CBS 128990) TaxID=675120 RepID=M2Y1S5_DOTSN|nr:hypothetical protein DOTSEDRAFT_38479 [Dothistroma septosporum NZE10]
MLPSLPTEIWLSILQHLSPQDLYLNTLNVNKRLRSCSDDILSNESLRNFTVSMSFGLGASTRARWYDIRGSVTMSFTSVSKRNPQYALFEKISVLPDTCHRRVQDTWNRICVAGVGSDVLWRVQLHRNASDESATTGSDVRAVKLPSLVVSEDHGVWCDWRELMGVYFKHGKVRETSSV